MTSLLLVIVAAVGYSYYTLVATRRFNGLRWWLLPLLVGFFTYPNVPPKRGSDQTVQLLPRVQKNAEREWHA